jgi:hypothetical protein
MNLNSQQIKMTNDKIKKKTIYKNKIFFDLSLSETIT